MSPSSLCKLLSGPLLQKELVPTPSSRLLSDVCMAGSLLGEVPNVRVPLASPQGSRLCLPKPHTCTSPGFAFLLSPASSVQSITHNKGLLISLVFPSLRRSGCLWVGKHVRWLATCIYKQSWGFFLLSLPGSLLDSLQGPHRPPSVVQGKQAPRGPSLLPPPSAGEMGLGFLGLGQMSRKGVSRCGRH